MESEANKNAKAGLSKSGQASRKWLNQLQVRQHAPESATFAEVLVSEISDIDKLRSGHVGESPSEDLGDAYSKAHQKNLAGLAFSGGGIRSATFNLGVIQALSCFGIGRQGSKSLLSRFDYLSTVSGGGYIGSWFSAWVHRDAKKNNDGIADEEFLNAMRRKFTAHPDVSDGDAEIPKSRGDVSDEKHSANTSGFAPMEHEAIRFLRRYSNYLTPKLGLSGDMLALVSIFMRNFVLMQLALITLLTTILMFLYLLASVSVKIVHSDRLFLGAPVQELALGIGLVSLLVVLGCFGYQIAEVPGSGEERKEKGHVSKPGVSVDIRNGLLVVASLFASWLIVISAIGIPDVAPISSYLMSGIACYLLAWFIGHGMYRLKMRGARLKPARTTPKTRFWSFFSTTVAGAVFGVLAYGCALGLNTSWASAQSNTLAIITFGPPVLLLVTSFIITIHIGTAGAMFSEMHREWWARIGGYVLFAMMIWTVVCLITYYAAPVTRQLGNGGFAAFATWAGASGAGALLARNATAGGASGFGSAIKKLVLRLAPWLFLLGMAVLVSYAVNAAFLTAISKSQALPEVFSFGDAVNIATAEFRSVPILRAVLALIISLAAFMFVTFGLDINIFSAHSMYKNRLTRAYLGASIIGNRHEHPFTGFGSADDLPLDSLSRQRPIHIVNTTVNMTGGDDLAWQTRRAASFSFTPKFVGYESRNSKGDYLGGYRATQYYGSGVDPGDSSETEARVAVPKGVHLGTAVAISGAAASPNMGYHTAPTVAALLTAFNLRLGYWGGNTADAPTGKYKSLWTAWWRKRPLFAGRPILAELTGSANAQSDWINLSDGGHFDNLGIYELVRRRCRFIVVTDAGCDGEHRFDDLANATRKCWTDFGVHISFPNLDEVSLKEGSNFVDKHSSLGTIEYPDFAKDDERRFGLILYVKSSITHEEYKKFVDLRQYANANETFPHETTADQFFDENQFEAYRHLGYCVVDNCKLDIQRFFDERTGYINRSEVYKVAKTLRVNRKSPPTSEAELI